VKGTSAYDGEMDRKIDGSTDRHSTVSCITLAQHQVVNLFLPLARRICFRCCWFVHLLATLRNNFQAYLLEIFREGWQWADEQMIKFWWQSGSRIHVATLVRHALAEVCTVPVLLVISISSAVIVMHGILTVLASDSRHARRSPAVDEQHEASKWCSLVVVSAFTFLHCFDSVGWETARTPGP